MGVISHRFSHGHKREREPTCVCVSRQKEGKNTQRKTKSVLNKSGQELTIKKTWYTIQALAEYKKQETNDRLGEGGRTHLEYRVPHFSRQFHLGILPAGLRNEARGRTIKTIYRLSRWFLTKSMRYLDTCYRTAIEQSLACSTEHKTMRSGLTRYKTVSIRLLDRWTMKSGMKLQYMDAIISIDYWCVKNTWRTSTL